MPTREEMISYLEGVSQQPVNPPTPADTNNYTPFQMETQPIEQTPNREEMTQYLESQTTPIAGNKDVINEAHPAIAWDERLKVKNFGGDIGVQMKYLQGKYPNLKIDQQDGNIIAKGKTEKAWRRLDPSSWQGFGEVAQDVGDIGYDVGAGLLEGAAAIGGSLAGGGVNPYTAAAGAGVAGAGLETLRQGIGKALGVGDFDMGESAMIGGISGILTPVFGVGGGKALAKGAQKAVLGTIKEMGLKGAARQEALKTGIGMAQKAASNLEKGFFKMGVDKLRGTVAPNIASFTSGVKSNDWKTYFKHFDEIEGWTDEELNNQAVRLYGDIIGSLENMKKSVSNQYEAIKKTGENINIKGALNSFDRRVNEVLAEIDYDGNPELLAEMKRKFKNLKTKVFPQSRFVGDPANVDIGIVNAITADKNLRESFVQDISKLDGTDLKNEAFYLNRVLGGKEGEEGIYKLVTKSIDDALEGSKYATVKKNYAAYKSAAETVKGVAKNPATLLGALTAIDTKAGVKKFKISSLKKLSEEMDIPFEETARKIRAYLFLKKPDLMPASGGATAISRSLLGGAIAGIAGGFGTAPIAAGMAAGTIGGSPYMMKQLGKLGKAGFGLSDKVGGALKNETTGKGLYRGIWKSQQDRASEEAKSRDFRNITLP